MKEKEMKIVSGDFAEASLLHQEQKEAEKKFKSFNPTLPLLTAFETATTASSWPITLLCSVFSRFFSLLSGCI